MSLEARKLSILEHLADISDEAIILQIENLIKPRTDFWDELPEAHKQIILKGIQDLDEGRNGNFDSFISKYKK